MTHTQQDFDTLFQADADPWQFRARWYERRKRALTLACLPQQRYSSGFEPGCANGELSAELATRCDALLVCDGAAGAVRVARERLRGCAHVQVRQAWLPKDWAAVVPATPAPVPCFDLIVVSELAYYLEPPALAQLAACLRSALLPGGTVLACHWRRPIAGCTLGGDAVQDALQQHLQLPHLLQVLDADLRLDVWRDAADSVAEREGLAPPGTAVPQRPPPTSSTAPVV